MKRRWDEEPALANHPVAETVLFGVATLAIPCHSSFFDAMRDLLIFWGGRNVGAAP